MTYFYSMVVTGILAIIIANILHYRDVAERDHIAVVLLSIAAVTVLILIAYFTGYFMTGYLIQY